MRERNLAIGSATALCVALLLVTLGVDQSYFANGITVSWRQQDPNTPTGEQGDFEVTRSVEHRVSFDHSHRAVGRYIQGWNYERLPPPMTPPIDAMVMAYVRIPAGPNRYVDAESSGRHVVTVDGEPIPAEGLSPGPHRVEVWWHDRTPGRGSTFRADAHFELMWGTSRDALDPIPRSQITPIEGHWPLSRKVFWWIAAALALALSTLLGRALLVTDVLRRRRLEVLATVVVIVLALAFRLFDYDTMPQYLENGDELFALWNGWSILHDGTPRGWTLWPGSYGGQPITMTLISMHGIEWHVIEPYFEHPPLLHVLVGGAAMLGGADDWSHARLMHGRLVPIALSTLSAWLVIALSRRFDGRLSRTRIAPHLAGLFYAVLPTIAIQGRVIKEEAILTPLVLGAVLSFVRWRDDGRRTRDVVIAAVLAGACMLAKVTGLAVLAALVMLFVLERAHREGLRAGVIGALVASLFPIFGAVINWQVFVETQRLQGGRPTHFNLFLRFFDDGMINMTLVGRGWLLFLWLATMATAFARPRRDTLALYLIPLFYLAAIGLGSGNWTYGWYISPVVPYLAIGAGRFLADLWREGDFVRGAVFSLTGLMYGFNFLLDPNHAKQGSSWPEIRLHVTLLLAAMLTPYALSSVFRQPRIGRVALALSLVVFTGLSAYFVTHYDVIYTRYHDFDRDAYFDR